MPCPTFTVMTAGSEKKRPGAAGPRAKPSAARGEEREEFDELRREDLDQLHKEAAKSLRFWMCRAFSEAAREIEREAFEKSAELRRLAR